MLPDTFFSSSFHIDWVHCNQFSDRVNGRYSSSSNEWVKRKMTQIFCFGSLIALIDVEFQSKKIWKLIFVKEDFFTYKYDHWMSGNKIHKKAITFMIAKKVVILITYQNQRVIPKNSNTWKQGSCLSKKRRLFALKNWLYMQENKD